MRPVAVAPGGGVEQFKILTELRDEVEKVGLVLGVEGVSIDVVLFIGHRRSRIETSLLALLDSVKWQKVHRILGVFRNLSLI